MVFFDAPVTFGSVSAIFLGFFSGIVYAVAKIKQGKESKNQLPTVAKTAEVELTSTEKGSRNA